MMEPSDSPGEATAQPGPSHASGVGGYAAGPGGRVQVQVAGVETGVYLLSFTGPAVEFGDSGKIKIRRRSLGKLRDLKAVLRRVLPEAVISNLPKLPAEGLLRKKDEAYLRSQASQVQCFLDAVAAVEDDAAQSALQSFLKDVRSSQTRLGPEGIARWEGFLYKQGSKFQTWKRRWFRMVGDSLYYYGAQGDEAPKGSSGTSWKPRRAPSRSAWPSWAGGSTVLGSSHRAGRSCLRPTRRGR